MSQHDTLTSTVDAIMEQAQVFASAWSLVGGMFDQDYYGKGIELRARAVRRLPI